MKCVFRFSLQLLSATFFILRRTERDVIKNNVGRKVKYSVAQKERMFFLYLPAISFFGVTSNQKCTFENLDLKVSIREEIATMSQEMLVNMMQNFEERLQTCVRQEGHHLSDIIFRH